MPPARGESLKQTPTWPPECRDNIQVCLQSNLAGSFSLGCKRLSPDSHGEEPSPQPCSLSGALAMLFLILTFRSSEAAILADGYLEPRKGQNHQTEPDKETAAPLMVGARIEV